MNLFEEGAKHYAFCYDTLDRDEQKITELTNIQDVSEDDPV